MNPILFESTSQTFLNKGLGSIDPMECTITEERNGQYELYALVAVWSQHYDDIQLNRILLAEGPKGEQPFRIYRIDQPLDGKVSVYARHLTYDLSYNTVMPFTASGVGAALTGLRNNAVETCPFEFWTDKTTSGTFNVDTPCSIRSRLGGSQGSILDHYGGEYEWDFWTVKLWNNRGTDRGVTLRYGKNITDLQQEHNLENVVTGIVPFWKGEDAIVTLPEQVIESQYADHYPFRRTVPVDFSQEWQEAPTVAQLRARGERYVTANQIGVPKVSLKVSFVPLWQTEEYKDIAPLERIYLCDTVGVYFERYDINSRAEMIKYEWNVLKKRYNSIELGKARSSMSSTIATLSEDTQNSISQTRSSLEKAISYATDMITGSNGGHIVLRTNADGEPYELLIMDTDDITTAQDVWRFNQAGLGHSSTGYNGPYTLGLLQNGSINASMITTGVLLTSLLQTGVIRSANDNSTWDLDTGVLTAKNFVLDSPYLKVSSQGSVIASDLTLLNNSGGENIIDTDDFIVNDKGQIVATGADISGTIKTGSTGKNILITDYTITGRQNDRAYGMIVFDGSTLRISNETLDLSGNLKVLGDDTWRSGSVVTSASFSGQTDNFVTSVYYDTGTYLTGVTASSGSASFLTKVDGTTDWALRDLTYENDIAVTKIYTDLSYDTGSFTYQILNNDKKEFVTKLTGTPGSASFVASVSTQSASAIASIGTNRSAAMTSGSLSKDTKTVTQGLIMNY